MGYKSRGVNIRNMEKKNSDNKNKYREKAKDKKTRESMFFQVTTEIVKAAISQKSAEAADIRE